MMTVYMADPALKFRCHECRSFNLVPFAGMSWTPSISNHAPYYRLNYYGVRGGHVWITKGINTNSHYMTEVQLGVCYFKNSV